MSLKCSKQLSDMRLGRIETEGCQNVSIGIQPAGWKAGTDVEEDGDGDVDDAGEDADDDGDERQPEWLLWYSAWLLGLIGATLVINHHVICQSRTTVFLQTLN